MDHNSPLAKDLNDNKWLFKLAYLTNVHSKISETNLALEETITATTVSTFKRKKDVFVGMYGKE